MTYQWKGLDPIVMLNQKNGAVLNGLHPLLALAANGIVSTGKLETALTMKIPDIRIKKIILIGCGGTGSHLLPNILQYVCQKFKGRDRPEVLLIDGDVV